MYVCVCVCVCVYEQALGISLEDPEVEWTVKLGFVAALLALNFAGIQVLYPCVGGWVGGWLGG